MYLRVHIQHSVVSDTDVFKHFELFKSRYLIIVMCHYILLLFIIFFELFKSRYLIIVMCHYILLSTGKEMTAYNIDFS